MLTPAELVWLIAAVAKGMRRLLSGFIAATRAKLFGVVLRILRRQDLAERRVIQEATSRSGTRRAVHPGVAYPDHMDGVDCGETGPSTSFASEPRLR